MPVNGGSRELQNFLRDPDFEGYISAVAGIVGRGLIRPTHRIGWPCESMSGSSPKSRRLEYAQPNLRGRGRLCCPSRRKIAVAVRRFERGARSPK